MADRIVLDGELSLNIPLDGEVGLMSLIEVGISEIRFNSDYTITFVMTDGRTFTSEPVRGESGAKGDKGDKGDTGDAGDDYVLTQQDKEDIVGLVDDKLIVNVGSAVSETAYKIDSTFAVILDALTRGVHVVVKDMNTVYPYVGVTQINNEFVIAFGTSITYENTSVLIGYIILQANLAAKVTQQAIIPTETSQLTNDSLVSDVLIDGTSIVQNGVANVPIASTQNYGVVKTHGSYGLAMLGSGVIRIDASRIGGIKAGVDGYHPLTPQHQHQATFYGLAKVAGHDEKDSTLPVGTYTEEAKTAIRTMLGIDKESLIAEIRDALNL